jgi:formylglycine-generating enzyme required for sulfatase activity
MSGNAWEWCQDRWGPYNSTAQRDPAGPESLQENETMELRMMRGGSVATTPDKCRVSNRNKFDPSRFRTTIGFRLAF